MNKLVIGLLVSVCLLGFALILLNEHTGSDIAATVPEKTPPVVAADAAAEERAPKITQNDMPAPKPLLPDTTHNNVPPKAEELASADVPPASEELKVPSAVEQDAVILPTPSVDVPPVDMKPVEEPKSVAPATHEKTAQPPKVEKPEIAPVAKIDTKEKSVELQQAVAPATKKVETPIIQEKLSPTPAKPVVEPKEKNTTTAAKAKTAAITLFTVLVRENGATVRLRANTALPFSASQLQQTKLIVKQMQDPERLIFDLAGAWDVKDPGVPNNIIVNKVRVGKMADRKRIVVDLKEKPKRVRVKVTDQKDGLDIFIDR